MSKKILITGGAGFIAHHVIDKILSTTDWKIITLDRLDFSGNLNRLNEVVTSYDEHERKRVKVVYHDLKAELNPEIIASYLANQTPMEQLSSGQQDEHQANQSNRGNLGEVDQDQNQL